MLRSGLVLLLASTVGVTLRSFELVDVSSPAFKLICSLTSVAAIACFLGTYCVAEFAHNKTHPRE